MQENDSDRQIFFLGIPKRSAWNFALMGLVMRRTGRKPGDYLRIGNLDMRDREREVKKVQEAFAAMQLPSNASEGKDRDNKVYNIMLA